MAEEENPFMTSLRAIKVKSKPVTIEKSDEVDAFGDLGIKKKVSTPALKSTSKPSTIGGLNDQGFLHGGNDLTPVQPTPIRPKGYIEPANTPNTLLNSLNAYTKKKKPTMNDFYNEDPTVVTNREKAKNKIVEDQENAIVDKQISDYKKKHGDGFWSGVGMGATFLASKVAKGVLPLAESGAYALEATNPMMYGASMPAVNQALDKADELSNLGLNKDYHGMGAIDKAIGGLAEFAPQILAAESTAGMSYFLGGVGNAHKEIRKLKEQGTKFENGSDDLYTLGSGVVNYLLMNKLPVSKLLSKMPSSLRESVAGKISMDALKQVANSGEKLTAEALIKPFQEASMKFSQKARQGGVNFIKDYAHTAKDLSILTTADAALKKVSNALSGEENFKDTPDDLFNNIKNILTSDAPAFALLGGAIKTTQDPGALFRQSPVRNEVLGSLKEDISPENLNQIKNDLAEHGQSQGWNPKEIENSINTVDVLHDAVKSIPKEFGDAKFNKAVDLITGRKELQDQLAEIKTSKESIDESIRDVPSKEESLIQSKLDQSNDKLRELATDKKFRYEFDEEKDTYTKQLGEKGKPEEITKDRYELEQLEKDFKKTKEEENAPIENKPKVDTEDQIAQEAKEAEDKFKSDGDQVTYDQTIKSLDERASKLNQTPNTSETFNKNNLKSDNNIDKDLYKEVLAKSEDDLNLLKKVDNKVAKYQGSIKRLGEALKQGLISEFEFNDTKARFDDVMADSNLKIPKVELQNEQGTEVNETPESSQPKSDEQSRTTEVGKENAPADKQELKEDIHSVFKQNKELSTIGDHQKYSQYVNTIFPDSKVKNVVYHGTDNVFDKFEKGHTDAKGQKTDTVGFHFIEKKAVKEYSGLYGEMKAVILDFKNPISAKYNADSPKNSTSFKLEFLKEKDVKDFKDQGYDSGIILRNGENEFVAFEPEQIHILGSKRDLEGFKKFVREQPIEDATKFTSEKLIHPIKEGTDFVFEKNPELANIGSKSDYSQHLSSVFPDSKIKDILYRSGNIYQGKQPIYFSTDKSYSDQVTPIKGKSKAYILNASKILTVENPIFDVDAWERFGKKWNINQDDGIVFMDKKREELTNPNDYLNDESIDAVSGVDGGQEKGRTIIVYDPKNVYELGSEKDIEGFRKFVSEKNIKPDNKVNSDEEAIKESEKTVTPKGDFEKTAHKSIESEEVGVYLSGKTINKYTGEDAQNNQEIQKVKLKAALEHGVDIVEKAKNEYGDEFVEKTLDYLGNNSTISTENKALIYISLENELDKQRLSEPENELSIQKKLDLVREKSQAFSRSAALATGLGRLRSFAKVGYDIQQVTNNFFSSKESESKSKIESAVQSNADEINKAALEQDLSNDSSPVYLELEKAISEGVEKQINDIYGKLPSKRREKADKAIDALTKIQKRLRSKTYDATIGVPVAIIDAGITTIKAAIKAGVNIADAIELGINKIKEKHGKNWSKEQSFREDMLNGFKEEGIIVKDNGPLTSSEKLENAKERIRSRIETVKQEIADKKRQLKVQGKSFDYDIEIIRLKAEEEAIISLRDKYIPKGKDVFFDEKKRESIADKLVSDIENINKQINEGERTERSEKRDPYQNEKINKLKSEKKARLDILEYIDPVPKNFIKEALIEKGFGREAKVNGQIRKFVDWKKLAGEEGSIDKLRKNVEESLKEKGYSNSEIIRMQDSFEKEYNNIRASVIEKALNELNNRNQPKSSSSVKTSAKRLAELYNYGLFEKESNTYDYLMNNALGMNEIGQDAFFKAKILAKSLTELFNSKNNEGKTIDQFSLKHGERIINKQIEDLLSSIVWDQANGAYKLAVVAKEYIGMAQRNALVSLPQALENTTSGYISRLFNKIGFSIDRVDTKDLVKVRSKLAKMTYNDIAINGGLEYGDVNSPFITKTKTQEFIDNASDSKLYHGLTSVALGKAYLEAADSMHKVALTEKFFAYNLIKILRKKGFNKQEAVNYVSEQLTGQSFDDALKTSKDIIDKINTQAGKNVIPDNKQSVHRFANDIVKSALITGGKLNLKEVEASLEAAYTSAGFELGHEANNLTSKAVTLISSHIQNKLNKSIKEKDWSAATAYTTSSIVTSNIMNPFVGGGTNWVFLSMQKAGIPTLSTLYWNIRANSSKIDLTTEKGMRDLKGVLEKQLVAKNANTRMLVGATISFATYALFKSTDKDEEFFKWLKKNSWAMRYFKKLSPPVVQFILAQKDKKIGEFFGQLMNIKIDAFDESKKAVKVVKNLSSDKKDGLDKAFGGIGDLSGSRLSTPIVPWRVVRDANNVYRGLNGLPEIKSDYQTSGFWNGFFKGGIVDAVGLRPKTQDNKGGGSGRVYIK